MHTLHKAANFTSPLISYTWKQKSAFVVAFTSDTMYTAGFLKHTLHGQQVLLPDRKETKYMKPKQSSQWLNTYTQQTKN